MKDTTVRKDFRLTKTAVRNLEDLAEYWHCNQTQALIRCLREFASLETERDALQQERAIIEAKMFEMDSIQQSLDEIKRMVANPVYVPATASESAANQGNARPLEGARAFDMPVFDDEDTLVIRRDESAGEAATNNFHASMMAMMNMQFEESENDQPTRRH